MTLWCRGLVKCVETLILKLVKSYCDFCIINYAKPVISPSFLKTI